MKIDGTNPLRQGGVRRNGRALGRSGNAFTVELDQDQAAASVAPSGAMTGVETLLALQEVNEDGRSRTRAKAQANAVLDQLEQIRMGLLFGFVPRNRLEQLQRLAEDLKGAALDPRLAEILAEIELRARVELAKLAPAA
jgi:hypothetical protein